MKVYIPTVLIVLALLLVGCGTTDPDTGERVGFRLSDATGFWDGVATATVEDAKAAHALAEQQGNEEWARCWATVETVALERQAGAGKAPLPVVGPLSALQRASNVYRDIRAISEDGLDSRVRADCAIVVADILRFVRRGALRLVPFVD